MSFDWTEYLNLARSLVGQSTPYPSEEAKKRCAISRAYYAALLKTRGYLASRIPPVVPAYGDNIHEFVPDELQKSRDRRAQKISEELRRMRKDRSRADYADTMYALSDRVTLTVKRAEAVIRRLTEL